MALPAPAAQFSVVDSQGRPVAGAVLEVWDENRQNLVPIAATDASGHLTLPEGARRWWLLDRQVRVDGYALWAPLAPGETRVVLEPARQVRVEVHDSDGAPVTGAVVEITHDTFANQDDSLGLSLPPPSVRDELETGSDGVALFRHAAQRIDSVAVTVRAAGFVHWRREKDVTPWGDQLVRVPVQLVRGGAVTGRILGFEGAPAPSASVRVNGHRTKTDGAGRFRVDGVVGTVGLVARHPEQGVFEGPLPDGPTGVAGEEIELGDVRLHPPLRVRFRLPESAVMAGYIAGPGVERFPGFQLERLVGAGPHELGPFGISVDGWVSLHLWGAPFGQRELARHVRTDAGLLDFGDIPLRSATLISGRVVDVDGRAVSRGIVVVDHVRAAVDADGRFALYAWGPGPFVPVFHAAGQSLPTAIGAPLVFHGDERFDDVVLVVAPPGSIEGTLRFGPGELEEIELAIFPQGVSTLPAGWDYGFGPAWDWVDKGVGRFHLENVPPGDYQLGVLNPPYEPATLSTEPRPVPVRVGSGKVAKVELTMPPYGNLEGNIESATGAAIQLSAAELVPIGPATGERDTDIVFKGTGVLRYPVSRDGTWVLLFRAEGHAQWVSEPMKLRQSEPRSVGTVRLEAGRVVRVTASPKQIVRLYELPYLQHLNLPPITRLALVPKRPQELAFIPNRELALVVSVPGYAPDTRKIPAHGDVDAVIDLQRGAPATIRVVDAERWPARGAEVFVLTEREQLPVAQGKTNPLGVAEFKHLPDKEPLVAFARRGRSMSALQRVEPKTELRLKP